MTAHIVHGDMLDLLPRWAAEGFAADAVITDPPYHLDSIVKRFGKAGSAPAQHGRDGAAGRLSRGFMGSDTDAGDIAFRAETWKLCLDVLKPGGRIAAFGGTRTWWKMAAAIDAAGFEIEDTIFWCYGQGLVLRRSRLRPAVEPIILARRPGPVQDLGIDDCRNGRDNWPSNLIHDGSPEVVGCFPDSPGQLAKASSNEASPRTRRVYGKLGRADEPMVPRGDEGSAARFFTECAVFEEEKRLLYHGKAKSRERISHCELCGANFLSEDRADHMHGQEDQSHLKSHPTVKPLSLMRHLVKLLVPQDGLLLDPFCGTASTLVAAEAEGRDAVGIEKSERYVEHGRMRLDFVASLSQDKETSAGTKTCRAPGSRQTTTSATRT